MRVAIVYNAPANGADAAEADVIEQVTAVSAALDTLGHAWSSVPCTLDLASLSAALDHVAPDAVFNLVEALSGTDRLAPLVPLLLDARGIPYTGTGSAAMLRSADKVAAKRRLRAAGLPTPDWQEGCAAEALPGRYIVKARAEHASLGLDDTAVLDAACADDLRRAIERRGRAYGSEFFAERFIPGREFNLALLGRESGQVDVLPPAEIVFAGFPPGKPHIVGYDAKWSPESFEYGATVRRLDFPADDRPLLERLANLALGAWRAFDLRGYARVDFRVDAAGEPWILEMNPNPCLAPDAGFAAALGAAGIPFAEAVRRMLAAAAAG